MFFPIQLAGPDSRSYLQEFGQESRVAAELKIIVVDDFFLSPLSKAPAKDILMREYVLPSGNQARLRPGLDYKGEKVSFNHQRS